ncbi:uncharacterized protein VTP21DRAFT_1479 [Calcarisporiella thermophila]|uniref:uncharacterized protein n=1 Tax=Calcarisporiella thermophila TaxID=911321 RepID=UPI00374364B8
MANHSGANFSSATAECVEFTSPEGDYTLKHDIFHADIQTTHGTHLSLVNIKYKDTAPNDTRQSSGESLVSMSTEQVAAGESEGDDDQPHTSTATSAPKPIPESGGSSSGRNEDSSFFSFGSGRRKKPKNNITKTNSSFVSRIDTHPSLARILASKTNENTYLFYNLSKSFYWADLMTKPQETISRIDFAVAHPTCHDANLLTRGYDHLDIVIGFSSSDLIWFDPLCMKYVRLNKAGVINNSPVVSVKWMPGSENLFMAAHQDGSIVIYDKDRDDQAFTPSPPSSPDCFHVTRPAKNSKYNPVSHWFVSTKPITAFAFSPDCQHVAVVGVDGCLRVIEFLSERLHDTYRSYFGGLSCVAWSPDGRYILTGGQDDLVTIWAFREQRIVARCQGHASWVTSVAFDPWRCDERNYRFGSVGEDTKLLLWDFSVSALHKPKGGHHSQRRSSLASTLTGASANTSLRRIVQENSNSGVAKQHDPIVNIVHPVLPKTEVAMLQPVMAKSIHSDPVVELHFREDAVVTTDRKGRVKVWTRPKLRTRNIAGAV